MGVSGGGRSMGFAGGRGMAMARPMAAPRMAYGAGGRVYAPRAVAPRVYGARNLAYAGQYRTAGVNTQYGRHRPPYYNHRRPYYGRWRGGGYYPYGAGASARASGWRRRPITPMTAITPAIAGSSAAGFARTTAAS